MPRTPAVTVPNSTALQSANSAPIWNVSAPGLVTISTPRKPTTKAVARAAPMPSLRKIADASVANSGEEKLMAVTLRSEEHTSELQSLRHLVCRLLLEKK